MSEGIAIIILLLKGLLTIHLPFFLDIYGTPFLVVGLIWYGLDYRKFSSFQKGIYILCVISSVISIWMALSMEFSSNKGIDGIGEAIAKGAIFNIASIISIVTAISLFVICTKSLPYRPIIIGGAIIFTVLLIAGFNAPEIIRRSKITVTMAQEENMHSVKEFEEELVSRNLLTGKGMVYGIDKDFEEYSQMDELSWENDANKKYPAYVYVFSVDNNLDKDAIDEKILRSNSWLGFAEEIYFYIYYINGQITAVPARCIEQFNERNIISVNLIFSETERVHVFDFRENKYIYLAEKDGVDSSFISFYDKSHDKFEYELNFLSNSGYYSEYLCAAFHIVDRVNFDSIMRGFENWAYQKN